MVHLFRRKAGTSLSEFSEYWRDEHGPLVAYHQARLGAIRYVQTHRDLSAEDADAAFCAARGGMEPPYDGASELWWPSEEAMIAARSTESGQRAREEIIADEDRFLDVASSPFWFAHEYPQVSVLRSRPVARYKTGLIKVYFPIRQLPGLSVSAAQLYWLTVHGPLVRSHASARGTICYQQVHRYESRELAAMREERGTRADLYIGHAEAWFDRLAPNAGADADAAAAAAQADERHFIDHARSTMWSGKELVFVERDWL